MKLAIQLVTGARCIKEVQQAEVTAFESWLYGSSAEGYVLNENIIPIDKPDTIINSKTKIPRSSVLMYTVEKEEAK
ncbi:hypothetical protein COK06_12515 [Bacillus cereus]|uniref:hypothetical protein n=1 Tax=Bacillus nitratireducens TaxID=2026193 RepID=UPI000BEBE962|nr:hypothetical protein [Bacillus nitratireducens]PEA21236.1 hypothetical protein CON40_10740 [Bacillus cereus]PEW01788.1 hypothetical protein CN428_15260 [Bacillus cereus]PEZ87318.1 hypothetical protein CN374_18720 [Bacillus cereus]PFA30141.1 hypothetical protein CN390_20570 [Bacillus cereus]PFB96321.1 hypothetical protein CN296_18235 [Bacillus cereus]